MKQNSVKLNMRPLNITCFVSSAKIKRKGNIDEVTLTLTMPLFKKSKCFNVMVKVLAGNGKRLVENMVKTRLMWD